MKDKEVLVTGGLGFLGGAIAQDLIDNGATVSIIDDMSVGRLEGAPESYHLVKKRVTAKSLEEEFSDKNFDTIYHFAAPCTVLLFDKDPMALYSNAIEAAYGIRKYASDHNVPYVVYASSATYYGKRAGEWFLTSRGKLELPVDQRGSITWDSHWGYQENMPPTPANIYGATKTAEEDLDTVFPGPNYLGLRIFPVYGPREWVKGGVSSIPYKIASAMLDNTDLGIWGDGTQKRDYIYIDDFVEVVGRLTDRKATGRINIGSGIETSHNSIMTYVWDVMQERGMDHLDWEPTYVKNPYADSYLLSLKSSNKLLIQLIGSYDFTPMNEGIKKMMDEMI